MNFECERGWVNVSVFSEFGMMCIDVVGWGTFDV